ncbi:glutathione-regulated potassium-efflux system protein KefC [Sulfurospirillum diekertiae]|uniref:Glutathione-regulated potassium-efflux system protein KefC n=1 Tax=Sulfurospirillum diekertiae TaxID=1854492 RepID=A0A290HUH8_9BACT|nr:monovalent cation:proton antiporter-2 (CPA2) family protein [Sulfurospirillum diekertiae]ATB69310.1 glutathione-regulated potassium-efflux system protein KefC [Sulfurospirillum diekertiae]
MDFFLLSALVLLAVTAIMVTISKHMGLGSILGLLIAGIIVGPHTPGPIVTSEVENLRHFTEFGVVMLLFIIGLEMQPAKLWSMRKEVFGLGSLQVIVSGVILGFYMSFFVDRLSVAMLLGFTLALSSTAFVMQILQEKGKVNTEHGKNAFAILLLQDLAVVPLLAALPLLSTQESTHNISWFESLATVVAMFGLLIVFGRYIIPKALDKVAKQRNKDAFLLLTLLSVVLSAYLMDHAGLSMALGAFLMGMFLSTSRYSFQIESSLEPFKGILMSLFFIAVGMSIDFKAIMSAPWVFSEHIVVILVLKALIIFVLMLAFGATKSGAIKLAFLLNQSGEFGFVLFGAAKALGIIDDQLFVVGIGVISISMLFTPVLYSFGCSLANKMAKVSQFSYFENASMEQKVVVAGYGSTGKVIAKMLKSSGIPFMVFDINANEVALGRKEGLPVFFGDITDLKLLNTIKLDQASMIIVSIDHSLNAIKVVKHIKDNYPHIKILARALDIKAMDKMLFAGASWVIAETLESSIRTGSEALSQLGVQPDEITTLLESLRKNEYELIREITKA